MKAPLDEDWMTVGPVALSDVLADIDAQEALVAHGGTSHDQSSHGNWADGGVPDVVMDGGPDGIPYERVDGFESDRPVYRASPFPDSLAVLAADGQLVKGGVSHRELLPDTWTEQRTVTFLNGVADGYEWVPSNGQTVDGPPSVEIDPVAGFDTYPDTVAYIRWNQPDVIKVQVNPSAMEGWDRPDGLRGIGMPMADKVPIERYIGAHEYAHVLQARGVHPQGQQSLMYRRMQDMDELRFLSDYGQSHPLEAGAEAFAEWVLSKGDTRNQAALAYAQHFRFVVPNQWQPVTEQIAAAAADERVPVAVIETVDGGIVLYDDGPVVAHASHDQSTHGNWARGGRSLAEIATQPGTPAQQTRIANRRVAAEFTDEQRAAIDRELFGPEAVTLGQFVEQYETAVSMVDSGEHVFYGMIDNAKGEVVEWRGLPVGLAMHLEAAAKAGHGTGDSADLFRNDAAIQQVLDRFNERVDLRNPNEEWRAAFRDLSDQLTEITGVSAHEAVADFFGTQWSGSTLLPGSLAAQDAAADLHGLASARESLDGYVDAHDAAPWLQEVRGRAGSFAPETTRAFVDATYRATQKALTAEGIDTVTVYRGMEIDAPGDGTVVMSPLSSWSLSPTLAGSFGSQVFEVTVPTADVFSMAALTGFGAVSEYEIVLLGREHPYRLAARDGTWVDGAAPPDPISDRNRSG